MTAIPATTPGTASALIASRFRHASEDAQVERGLEQESREDQRVEELLREMRGLDEPERPEDETRDHEGDRVRAGGSGARGARRRSRA